MLPSMILSAMVAVAVVAGSVRPARADAGFSLGVEGGVMEFDARASLGDAGVAWGLRGGIGLFGPTRLEARYLSSGHDLAGGHSANVREGDAQLRLSLLPGGTTPYLFGGIGLRVSDTNQPGPVTSDSTLMVPLGAGLDLPLTRQLFLAPEFTWHHRLGTPDPQVPTGMAGGDTWNVSLVLRVDI